MRTGSSKKRLSILVLICVLAATLAACASDNPDTVPEGPAPDTASVPATPDDDPTPGDDDTDDDADDTLTIAIITSPNSVDDGAFNENCYGGVLAFLDEHPEANATPIQEPIIDLSVLAVEEYVEDYDVIVTPSASFAGIGSVALDNPEKYFILIDVFPRDTEGNTIEVSNIYAVQYKEQDRGFIAGVAAALETQTGKVATVGGMATVPPNVNDQFGFEAGVHYANAHLGTDVEIYSIPAYAGVDGAGNDVGGNYVGAFDDADLGKLLAGGLYDAGVDIIFTFAGGSSNGVFGAAMERDNVYVIGAGVDQFDLGVGNGKSVVLTSVIKMAGVNVKYALDTIADGSFRGGNNLLGIETGSVGYVQAPGRHQLSDNTLSVLEDVLLLIEDGSIVPPHSGGDSTPTAFPGL